MINLHCLIIVCFLPFGVDFQEIMDDDGIVPTVTKLGYPIETHHVVTEDGYILAVFRIPRNRYQTVNNKQPILLTHGMFGSSENFIMLGPKKALAYLLAENGYDVWMVNCRGAWHSKNHTRLDPSTKEFWDFSWHEMGLYDLPAVIDYILDVTGKNSLFYAGHSQGGTAALVMASEKPQYAKKIKLMLGLAAGAFYRYIRNDMLRMVASNVKLLQAFAETMHIYQLPPKFFPDSAVRAIQKAVCVDNTALKSTCQSLFMLFTEETPNNVDINTLPTLIANSPASSSTKQAFHYAQLINSGLFQQYDYGPVPNKRRYGTSTPPEYNLKNVQFPVVLFSGKSDKMVSANDTLFLAQQLPNLVGYEDILQESFGHFDYIIGKNAKEMVYLKMLQYMKKYKNK